MSPEINEQDAIRLAVEYYEKRFPFKDAVRIVAILSKIDIAGLIIYAFNQDRAEHQ